MNSLIAVLVVSAFVTSSAVITDLLDNSKLVRRHQDAMQIGAQGDTAVIEKPEGFTKTADLCNVHFLEGVEKTNDCADPTIEVVIEGEAMCKSAAALTSGIGCTDEKCLGTPFEITSESFNIHPMRCYIDGGQWFYNPSGYEPANITAGGGTPICRVPELREGTQDSNDCGHTAYEPIVEEAECRAADTCMGACINEDFRVSDDASPRDVTMLLMAASGSTLLRLIQLLQKANRFASTRKAALQLSSLLRETRAHVSIVTSIEFELVRAEGHLFLVHDWWIT